jgi:hypothetical protein
MHRPPFTLRNISGAHFCYRMSLPQGHSGTGMIKLIKKSNDLIGNRTRDLPACSIVPQATKLTRADTNTTTASVPMLLLEWKTKRGENSTQDILTEH